MSRNRNIDAPDLPKEPHEDEVRNDSVENETVNGNLIFGTLANISNYTKNMTKDEKLEFYQNFVMLLVRYSPTYVSNQFWSINKMMERKNAKS